MNVIKKYFKKITGAGLDPNWKETNALFFLSTGRSGTTTVANALSKLSGIQAYHEPRPHTFDSRYHIYQEGRLDAEWIERDFTDKRKALIKKASFEGMIYAESSAFLSFHCPVIAAVMSQASFIYMHRDPFEFVRSGMRRGWYDGHANAHVRLRPRLNSAEDEMWSHWDRFHKICWLWAEFNEYCLNAYEKIPSSRRLMLKSDELWGNPQQCAGEILSLLGVGDTLTDSLAAGLSTKCNAQNEGDFKERSEWDAKSERILNEICGATMGKLGYA